MCSLCRWRGEKDDKPDVWIEPSKCVLLTIHVIFISFLHLLSITVVSSPSFHRSIIFECFCYELAPCETKKFSTGCGRCLLALLSFIHP